MGPGSADRHLRSADRNSSGRTNQQDDSLRTVSVGYGVVAGTHGISDIGHMP